MYRDLNKAELSAVLAGLRLLQHHLDSPESSLPADIEDILVNECGEDSITKEQIDSLCERLNTPETRIWEVTAAGFEADTDDTDDRVYWVRAANRKDVANALRFTGAKLCHEVSAAGTGADFDLTQPGQAQLLGTALLEWADIERNKSR